MGHGFPTVNSKKKKLNEKSSTETEIMDIEDFMPAIFWTQYFIAEQGYNVKYNCLHQDNKSFIIFENNGKAFSSKKSEHIHIRYLFITDRVKNGEVSVVWCPTGDLIGDYMTKHMQGDSSLISETKSWD